MNRNVDYNSAWCNWVDWQDRQLRTLAHDRWLNQFADPDKDDSRIS